MNKNLLAVAGGGIGVLTLMLGPAGFIAGCLASATGCAIGKGILALGQIGQRRTGTQSHKSGFSSSFDSLNYLHHNSGEHTGLLSSINTSSLRFDQSSVYKDILKQEKYEPDFFKSHINLPDINTIKLNLEPKPLIDLHNISQITTTTHQVHDILNSSLSDNWQQYFNNESHQEEEENDYPSPKWG